MWWTDQAEASLAWFAEVQAPVASPPPLGISVVMGPQFLSMAENFAQNLQEGRVQLVQAVLRRA